MLTITEEKILPKVLATEIAYYGSIMNLSNLVRLAKTQALINLKQCE
jgi:hypothetical protein